MKHSIVKKLSLNKETIADLGKAKLDDAKGGTDFNTAASCFRLPWSRCICVETADGCPPTD